MVVVISSHLSRVDDMVRARGTFLIPVYVLICKILGFLSSFLYRNRQSKIEEWSESRISADHSEEDDRAVSDDSTGFLSGGLAEKGVLGVGESEGNCPDSETEDSVFLQSGLFAGHNMYQFRPMEGIVGLMEEPGRVQFSVQEMFLGWDEGLRSHDGSSDHENLSKTDSTEKKSQENQQEFDVSMENFDSKPQEIYPEEEKLVNDKRKVLRLEEDEAMEEQDFSYEIELFPRNQFPVPEANQSSDFVEFKFLFNPQRLKQIGKPFLEEDDDLGQSKMDLAVRIDSESVVKAQEFDPTPSDLDDDEFIELEPKGARRSPTDLTEEKNEGSHETEVFNGLQEFKNSWESDTEDEDEEEDDEWSEHQHLVQQMKMELRNCRIGGLPTISEDCETPKVVDDLKPLKIEMKFEYKDLMAEIQKFHRSYAGKMRKLDILNFQTLQAIGLLQFKDSEELPSCKKKLVSLRKSLSFPKIWPCKVQRVYADPAHRSAVELNRDLELIYLGQLCLSWEILGWLYLKAKELLPYDSQGSHSYNRVVEEFQQFQVLMHRFMEDERFQGPRIQNYTGNRCVTRCLLQVPMIRDDSVKDKKERKEGRDAISLDFLLGTIKDSMLVFWEFLRSDKCSKDVASNCITASLQEHANSTLLVDMIATLQKKERRLRDNIRSKKCIVKKVRKPKDSEEWLRCEVELRLVSRVLGLPRLSAEQLEWCKGKLESIKFENKRIHLEPSFLLFPC